MGDPTSDTLYTTAGPKYLGPRTGTPYLQHHVVTASEKLLEQQRAVVASQKQKWDMENSISSDVLSLHSKVEKLSLNHMECAPLSENMRLQNDAGAHSKTVTELEFKIESLVIELDGHNAAIAAMQKSHVEATEALVKQNSKNLANLREMHVGDTKALQEKVESQDQQLVAWGEVTPLREELSSLKELLEFKNSKIHALQQDAKAKEKFLEVEKSNLRLEYNNLKRMCRTGLGSKSSSMS
ncbi:uncharacterized protein RSE6_01891 [Rhynchosporium secalis]|uniref:Uncharacterized protein n=1 Tax=Rhynchosporium secalis TaxID=38038 RepID=A0A1E1LYY2_RHYSE|nr:uncharacterized protein RSE6_01891 [Rhynchosporium secalis]